MEKDNQANQGKSFKRVDRGESNNAKIERFLKKNQNKKTKTITSNTKRYKNKKEYGLKNNQEDWIEKESEIQPKPEKKKKYQKISIDGAELNEMTEEEKVKIIHNYVCYLISMKEWSETGLKNRIALRYRKVNGIELYAEKEAKRMMELGALDNQRYARVALKQQLNKVSLSQALKKMEQEGVPKEDFEQAIDDLKEEGYVRDEDEQAWFLWKKKFNRLPMDEKEKQKQMRFCAGKGLSWDQLNKIWKRFKESNESGDEMS